MSRLAYDIYAYYPNLPIRITENGLADDIDENRMPFITAYLNELALVIKEGVQVEGYCHWTLNDNFEWAEGYWPPFGCYKIEKGTQNRVPRPSLEAFTKLISEVKRKPRQ